MDLHEVGRRIKTSYYRLGHFSAFTPLIFEPLSIFQHWISVRQAVVQVSHRWTSTPPFPNCLPMKSPPNRANTAPPGMVTIILRFSYFYTIMWRSVRGFLYSFLERPLSAPGQNLEKAVAGRSGREKCLTPHGWSMIKKNYKENICTSDRTWNFSGSSTTSSMSRGEKWRDLELPSSTISYGYYNVLPVSSRGATVDNQLDETSSESTIYTKALSPPTEVWYITYIGPYPKA